MRRPGNGIVAGGLATLIVGMVGLSYAAVPLYRLFCQATGYGGTPQIGTAQAPGGVGQSIEVRFDANTGAGLAWQFTADQFVVATPLGEDRLASYTGRNRSGETVTGVATYNVSPEKAARYFHKTACFCFDQQTLAPGQQVSFPLSFWIDPEIRNDPNTRDVRSITLSYTFFRSLDDAARQGGVQKAGPHVGARAETGDALSSLNPGRFSR